MPQDDTNPYAPPNPLEATKPSAPQSEGAKRDRPSLKLGTVLWWAYFAICCWVLCSHGVTLIRVMHGHPLSWAVSPLGFMVLFQALGLVGLLCYLCRVPLLHPFLWGMIFYADIGLTIYDLVRLKQSMDRLGGGLQAIAWMPDVVTYVAFKFAPLLECYALWRYSSSSSPIWKRPRIAWKQLGRRFVDAIRYLRRA